jgi:hypothetical protein
MNQKIVFYRKLKAWLINSQEMNKAYKNHESFFDDIPEFIKNDMNNNKFIQYDSGAGCENRFIILFSDNNRSYLEQIDCVLIEGTSWCVPNNF